MFTDTWSFDVSSVCASSISARISQEQKSITFYKQRTKILANTTGVLALMFMIVVLFVPYSQIRNASYVAITKLSAKHLRLHAAAIQTAVELFLTRVSISTTFLAEMSAHPKIIGCNDDMIIGLVETLATVRRQEDARYNEMWVYENTSNHCLFTWNGEQMHMWYSVQTDRGTYNVSFFDENTEWEHLDIDSGVHIEEIENASFPVVVANTTTWTLIGNGASMLEYSEPQITVIASRWFSTSGNIVVGTVVDLKDIDEVFRDVTEHIDCEYALITEDGQIIIDSFTGVIEPKEVDVDGTPIFPQLSERSEFWAAFEPYIGIDDGKMLSVELRKGSYLVTVDSLFSGSKASPFRILTVFAIDAQHEHVLRQSSIALVVAIGLLFIVAVVVLWVRKRTKEWKKRKRMKQVERPQLPLKGEPVRLGALGRGIERLRNLQLMYPSETKFNAVLDSAIASLAETRSHVFGVVETSPHQCQFCANLVEPSLKSPEKEPKGFHSWSRIRKTREYPRLGELFFDWDFHSREPIASLLQLMDAIMKKEKFTFPSLDPDAVLRFMYSFATQSCQDHVKTAHVVSSVYYLITKPDKYWIQSSVERFILILATFLFNTDCSIAYEAAGDSDFSEDTEKVWHSDASDTEQPETSSDVHMLFNVLRDEESAVSRNTDFIIQLFRMCVPPVDDPIYEFVLSALGEILPAIHAKRQFALLGEFCVRAESPSFSVLDTVGDRILFMEALLKLGEYSAYWSDHDVMLKACQRLTYSVLPPDASDTTIAEFHYIHASKIVSPWISSFVRFDPLPQIVTNFNANLNFWKSQI